MTVNYVPPSQKLFKSRHRICRRDLQQLSSAETDWTTVLDLPIDSDSQLISYTVPVIGDVYTPPQQCDDRPRFTHMSNRSTIHSECSYLSNVTDTSSIFEPDLKRKMQGNVSLESLLQENKKKILKRHESIDLLKSMGKNHEAQRLTYETKKEVLNLKSENRHLLVREQQLTKAWEKARREENSALVLAIRSRALYWFGIPDDIRLSVYRDCLYDCEVNTIHNTELHENISKCLKNEKLSRQIYANLSRNLEWFNSDVPCKFGKMLETRMQQQFSGLYYYLKDTLKISIFQAFIKPLIINGLNNALQQHIRDEIGLELLDILVFTTYTNELENIILDDFLHCILGQTYHKYFISELQAFAAQLSSITIDLVQVLESVRQKHGKSIIEHAHSGT